jgi:glutaminase
MSATLADGGINPVTGQRAVTAATCQHVLAVMATAGGTASGDSWRRGIFPGRPNRHPGRMAVLNR